MNLTFIEKAVESGLALTVRLHHEGGFQVSVGAGFNSHNVCAATVIEALARLEVYLARR